jgi:hypothetical protein
MKTNFNVAEILKSVDVIVADNKYENNNKNKIINTLIFKNWIWIELKIDNSLNSNEFRVYSTKRKKDVTNEV